MKKPAGKRAFSGKKVEAADDIQKAIFVNTFCCRTSDPCGKHKKPAKVDGVGR